MIQQEGLEIKKLDFQGLKTLLSCAKAEGWNPGEEDAKAFWNTDPDGYYGFYLKEELIAGGAIISYNQEFGFMGLFIVHPNYRGHGIGKKLWYLRRDLLLQRLKQGAPIGMDGVVAMQPFYEKGGFTIAFKDVRYERKGEQLSVSENVSAIHTKDFEELLKYDMTCFGFKRETFLKNWLALDQSHAYKFTKNHILKGFAVIRKVNVGYKIGPLFADNTAVAEELYRVCLNSTKGKLVYLDIPLVNKSAVELVKKYDAKYAFECARMYYGNPPKVNMDKVFGITTFELG